MMEVFYDKLKRMIKSSGNAVFMFFAVIFGIGMLNLVSPKKNMLVIENRPASQFPDMTKEVIMNGEWAKDFSGYMQDQMAFREQWIDISSFVNAVVFQKTEENGILLGKNHWMFTKMFALTDSMEKQFQKNISAIYEFAERHPDKVTFMLVPSSSFIYSDMLPDHSPNIDESEILENTFDKVGEVADVIDLRPIFRSLKTEYLYYKTDHHWTANGSYRAYEEYCSHKNLIPFNRLDGELHETKIMNFYGTHYAKTRLWNAESDELSYYPQNNKMTIYKVIDENQNIPLKTENIMNLKKLESYDKYSAFLDGNNGYSVIEGSGSKNILVVKDSYANCFVPYLTENYKKIGVVDYRNYSYGLDGLIERENYDEVLILYSFQNFLSDSKVVYINRPSTIGK